MCPCLRVCACLCKSKPVPTPHSPTQSSTWGQNPPALPFSYTIHISPVTLFIISFICIIQIVERCPLLIRKTPTKEPGGHTWLVACCFEMPSVKFNDTFSMLHCMPTSSGHVAFVQAMFDSGGYTAVKSDKCIPNPHCPLFCGACALHREVGLLRSPESSKGRL